MGSGRAEAGSADAVRIQCWASGGMPGTPRLTRHLGTTGGEEVLSCTSVFLPTWK